MSESNKATAKGIGLPVSRKQCIEVCRFVRGKSVKKAKEMLEKVIAKKAAVPMKRYNADTGHKKGKVGPGRYPVNASTFVLSIIKSAESNALSLGLNTEALKLSRLVANKGAMQWHFGRQRRRKMKRTNIEVVVEEAEAKHAAKSRKAQKPEAAKTEPEAIRGEAPQQRTPLRVDKGAKPLSKEAGK